ncbi:MAG: TonB-dependent receptor [Cyclobacteriaceae bacterium]
MKNDLLRLLVMTSKYVCYGFMIQFFTFNLLFATDGIAQYENVKDVRITLHIKDASFAEVIQAIESKTSFKFTFEEKELAARKGITVHADDQTLEHVLLDIGKTVRVHLKQVNDNIHVKSAKERKRQQTIEVLQAIQVTGTVTSQVDRTGLPGVNVFVRGTSTGTITDVDGKYSISVPNENDTLMFSSIGYVLQEVPVNGRSTIDVVLSEDIQSLDEIVVVGYGTQRKSDLTGAIDIVDTETLLRSSANNPLEALQGQMPGAYVTTSGAPGADVGIVIRGLSTLGDNSPLYIIDGLPTKTGINNIDASNIENIQILKDAAASSIYGSRASNGVIIIETKKGTRNRITFDSRITTQKYQSITPVLNTDQRGRAMWQAFINEGNDPNDHPLYDYDWNYDSNGNPVLNSVMPIEWISEELGIRSTDTDWWGEVTQPGLIVSNELTLSTGGEAGGSRLAITHYTNKGVFINDKFNRINFNLNSHYKFLNDAIEIGENLVFTSSTRYPDHVRGGALTIQPIIPVYTEDGGWGGPWGAGFEDWLQPVMDSHINSWDNTQTKSIMGSAYMAVNFTENLQFRSTLGVEYQDATITDIQRPYESGFLHREIANLTINKNDVFNWSLSNTLNYNISFNKHSIGILAGTELYKNNDVWLYTFADDFASDERDYYEMSAAVGTQTVSGTETGYQLLSFFGKVNYNFADKYLLAATLRYDGSSRFGVENRFGTFPSISAGWRMDQEGFIKDNFAFINFLKPRYGFGIVGNQEIGNDAALALYEARYGEDYTWDWDFSTSYDINGNDSGNLPSGFRRLKAGNPLLKWETTTENNFGLDFGFLGMALTGSFDYYVRKSKDILIQPPYLGAIGEGGDKWYNGATVENRGWEFTLEYRKTSGDFSYAVSTNIGHFEDEITFLPEDVVRAYPGNVEQTILGHSQQALFGYVADGLFQNQGEVDEHADQVGKDIGRIRYADLNDDGVINALDQKFQGNTLPAILYGLNVNVGYKRWALNFFLNGETGKNVYNNTKQNTDFIFSRAGINYGTRVLGAWTPQNSGSSIPALITSNKNNEYRSSSYFIENGSYMKVRNVELSYNFNVSKLKYFENLRVFFIGENLALVKGKSYTGPDPENPNNGYGRPLKLTFGVNFSL